MGQVEAHREKGGGAAALLGVAAASVHVRVSVGVVAGPVGWAGSVSNGLTVELQLLYHHAATTTMGDLMEPYTSGQLTPTNMYSPVELAGEQSDRRPMGSSALLRPEFDQPT